MRQILCAILLSYVIWGAGHSSAQEIEVRHYDELYDLAIAPPLEKSASIGAGPIVVSFVSMGHSFSLSLEPNARINTTMPDLSPGTNQTATAYRGTLIGKADSWVRLVISDQGPTGLIWDGNTLFALEAAADTSTSSRQTSMFRLDDVYAPSGALSCGVGDQPTSGKDIYGQIVTELNASAALTATLNLNVGLIADYEFSTDPAHATDPAAALLTRINNVDGIFSEQVGVRLTPTEVEFFDAESDPFTETAASALLDELRDYRSSTLDQRATGLTHLFTGRNLDGTTVGIAYFGAVCSASFGAGLSEGRRGSAMDSLIAAHEIGHNFGAPHDGDPAAACADAPETFLMASQLSNTDQFSQCSIDQMRLEIDRTIASQSNCLTRISMPDLDLTSPTMSSSILADAASEYTLTLANRGAAVAVGASVDVTFGAGLLIEAVTPGSGSCEPPHSSVSCTLGDIPGGTSRDIVFTIRSQEVGEHAIVATATIADDPVPENNSLTDILSVLPAVDLSLAADSISIQLEQSSALTVDVENASGFAANDIVIDAQIDAGMRLSSATINGNACTVDDQSLHCALAALPSMAVAVLRVVLTGEGTGIHTATLSVVSAEEDIDPSNNALVVSVNVLVPPTQSSGGGGSSGLITMLGLLGLAAIRRRRSRACA